MMPHAPFMKWFPSDWRGDPLVRACTPLSRYVWMEMLGLMHEAEPYGHLVIGGRAMDYGTLSQLIAVDSGSVKRAVKELEANGVFSRTDDGAIYSRRMVRDKIKAENAKTNGGKGGNPVLKKQRLTPSSDKPPDKPPDKTRLKPHIPYSRSQKESSSGSSAVQCDRSPTERRHDDYDLLEKKLREAAEFEQRPEPAFSVLAPILGLLDAGFDLERDVLPSIRRQAKSAKDRSYSIGGWSYFVKGIQQEREQRGRIAAGSSPPAEETIPDDPAERQRLLESSWRFILKQAATNGIVDIVARNRKIPPEFVAKWKAEQAEKLGKSA